MERKRGYAATAVAVAMVLVGPSVVGRGLPAAGLPSEPPATDGSAAGAGTWVTHGPTTPKLVVDLVMDPSNPDILYAATSQSTKLSHWGVLKSTDGAQTWAPAFEGITGVGQCGCIRNVVSLAIDPNDPDVVYAGAQTGVFRTTNGGVTWTGGGGPQWAYVAIDPSSPGTVYAGSDSFASETPLDGVFKSTDGGLTWTEATEGLDATYGLRSLVPDPFHADTLYAGTAGRGAFKTTDGGASWAPVNDGLTGLGGSTYLLADPFAPDTLYAGSPDGLFQTTDGGPTWQRLTEGLPSGGFEPLTADPSQPGTIYVGGSGLYRTTDGGSTWSALPADTPTSMRARGDVMYIGGSGVYKSTDGGATWHLAIQGFEIESPVYSIAIDPSDPRRIYAGLDNNSADGASVWISEDAGLTWRPVAGAGLPNSPWVDALAVPPSPPGTVYLAAHSYRSDRVDRQEKKGVYRSTDYGATWTRIGPPIDVDDQVFFASGVPAYSLAIDPTDPDTIYVGGRGFVYKSIDGGFVWAKVPVGAPEFDFIYAVATDPSNPLNVYAGSGTAGFYKSVTAGLGFAPAMAGLTNRSVASIAIDPSDPDTIYAGTCCALSGVVDVYKSTTGGLSWSPTGLAKSVVALAVDPTDPDRVYAGTIGEGVWASEDGGATWAEANDGFPETCPVHALAVDPDGSRVYAGAEFGQPGCSAGGLYVLERTAG